MYLVYERETGIVVSSIDTAARPTVMDHHKALKFNGAELPDFQTVRVKNGRLVSDVSEEYVASLKRQMVSRIEAARDAALAGGVSTQWGIFQADLQSSTNINGAVSMAILGGEAFTIDWRTADNQTVTLDSRGMIGVGVSVGQYVAGVYARSWALKEAIDAATTPKEIKAIDISFPATLPL